MTNAPANTATTSSVQPEASDAGMKQIVLKEIGAKWGKFSESDLSSLRSKDDLVTQLVAKYGLDKGQAHRDADTLLKGRQI